MQNKIVPENWTKECSGERQRGKECLEEKKS
jgi:hypothetical protein